MTNPVYDEAAGLLAAAQALEAAARTPASAAVLHPTLVCLEISLRALAGTAESLRDRVLDRGDDVPAEARLRMTDSGHDLARLAGVIEQAADAGARAQRSIAALTSELAPG